MHRYFEITLLQWYNINEIKICKSNHLLDAHWHSCNVRCLSNFYFLHSWYAFQFRDQYTVWQVRSPRYEWRVRNFGIAYQRGSFQVWCHGISNVSCKRNGVIQNAFFLCPLLNCVKNIAIIIHYYWISSQFNITLYFLLSR